LPHLLKPGQEHTLTRGWCFCVVEFRLIVFRPFKGEIIVGTISNASRDGIKSQLKLSTYRTRSRQANNHLVSTQFFGDIHVPPQLLFPNTDLFVSPLLLSAAFLQQPSSPALPISAKPMFHPASADFRTAKRTNKSTSGATMTQSSTSTRVTLCVSASRARNGTTRTYLRLPLRPTRQARWRRKCRIRLW
jgi:hypothetical protein